MCIVHIVKNKYLQPCMAGNKLVTLGTKIWP